MRESEGMRSEKWEWLWGIAAQITKGIVGHCEDLGVYTEGDGEFLGEMEHFLTYVVKKMAPLCSKIDRRRA